MEYLYMKHLNAFISTHKYVFPALIYLLLYLVWFLYLEKTVTQNYTVIHMAIDDYIPFCEVFIIPYYLWFAYVAVIVVYLALTSKTDFLRACAFLFTGMTVFLIISTLWPNGQHLRPATMPRDNIFTQLVVRLYRTDTPTNIWPSIHVYNAIGAHLAIAKCSRLAKYKKMMFFSFLLCVSIILSTMFLKQHSAFDVLTALGLALVMYGLVYGREAITAFRKILYEKIKSSSRPARVS